jgi:hypothetical protein
MQSSDGFGQFMGPDPRYKLEIRMTWMWGAAYAAVRNRLEHVRGFQRDQKG